MADGLDINIAAEETIVSTTSDDIATQESVRRIIKAAGQTKAERQNIETLDD